MESTVKRALFAGLVATFVYVLIVFRAHRDDRERVATRVPKYNLGEMIDIFQEEQRLDEAVDHLHLFRQTLRQTREELLKGSLQLDEAALRVEKAAQENNPAFFPVISDRFPGLPMREKLSLVLLSYLESDAEQNLLTPEEKRRVAELRQDYERRSNLD
jgi:hypothetical protein